MAIIIMVCSHTIHHQIEKHVFFPLICWNNVQWVMKLRILQIIGQHLLKILAQNSGLKQGIPPIKKRNFHQERTGCGS